MSRCAFTNNKMDWMEVYMAGPVYADKITGNSNTCIASPRGNFFDFSISGDLTDCGTNYVANETHISYSNAIQELFEVLRLMKYFSVFVIIKIFETEKSVLME